MSARSRRLTSEQRLARIREEKRQKRERGQKRELARRLRVAKTLQGMEAGQSLSAASKAAHTTPESVVAIVSAGSLRRDRGRYQRAASSRVRLDLGRAQVLTTEGVMPVRLRTLRDWELWQAQDRLIQLVADQRPVPADLERKLRGAKIDGLVLVSSAEMVEELAVRGALDDVEVTSPTLTLDDQATL